MNPHGLVYIAYVEPEPTLMWPWILAALIAGIVLGAAGHALWHAIDLARKLRKGG